MPVHFTCPHCTQLLSVARRKVGEVVQCANCNGGVMVPPPVELDDDDASAPRTAQEDNEEPQISTDEPLSEEVLSSAQLSTPPGQQPAPMQGVRNDTIPVTRFALYTIGALIVGTAIASFVLGWAMGRGTMQNQIGSVANVKNRIFGRVSNTTGNGRKVADTKSVVVALPRHNKPDEKLAINALRPDRVGQPNVQDPTIRAIRSMGGDFALTNRTGDYELEVSEPGEYYVLILSSHVARSANKPPITTEIVELGQYFRQADQLLGKNDYVWAKHIVKTEKQWDILFGDD